MILTAESKEEIKKHSADPHNRYSVIDDLDLHIKNVSLSDSGIYYCNANPTVNLTVTAPDFSKPTTSSKSSTEATTPAPEISTSVAQTRKTHHTDQPKPTQELHHQRSTEGADVFLICKNEGKVQWTKVRDGYRLMILTGERSEEIKKHNADPHNRYSVTDDLDLHIKNVSLSDSGIYYCNATATVNLTVTAPDFSKPTASSKSSTEATTPPPVISTSVAQTRKTHHTDQPKPTQDELKATTGSIHRHSEDSTPAPDSSTAFTYYCMKEN
ncbi:myosin light chain kinase, smooth muscle-like [Triplophysa dalaica]|uniref:myosin light chain kinase, smooth muscle-like n=1 Tax=Triplophysa dalaica TaxID=1582913 RepID=UPI0024DFE888|nr:myosin light chain kinase, smooth muscle-like [Triplophysa dalaica]